MNKKYIVFICILAVVCVSLTACGPVYQHVVGNRITSGGDIQTFHYAYINTGNNVIEGYVSQWRDYDESDVVQVMLDDGKTYLTHYTNVVLVADPKLGVGYSSGLSDYN